MWLAALAVAPGLFLLWYFRARDRLRPEPRSLVWRTFAFGALLAIAAALAEGGLFWALGLDLDGPFTPAVLGGAVFVGLIEEAAKFLAVFFGAYRQAQFDEVMDGILYAVAASMGLATIENVFYVLDGGLDVGVLRALLSVPGHAFFGAVLGFYMGVAKFSGRTERWWLAAGVLMASAVHAAYDAAVFTGTLVALLVIPFVLLLWRASLEYVRRALDLDDRRLGAPLAAARRLP